MSRSCPISLCENNISDHCLSPGGARVPGVSWCLVMNVVQSQEAAECGGA